MRFDGRSPDDLMKELAEAEQTVVDREKALSLAKEHLDEVKREIVSRLLRMQRWCGICGIGCKLDHK